MSGSRHVVVVGGGLAGIAAALDCADGGCEVTLVEARAQLGGLTHSFQRGGLWVDNGQHVFLRCCTSYLWLLDRLGVADRVHMQDRLDVPVRSGAQPGTARLRRDALPAPLHLLRSLVTYRWLTLADRVRVMRAALALGRVDRGDPAVDTRSFAGWLTEHGQSDRAVEAVWDLIGVATLNARADAASLALAATVFQLGLLDARDAADIGWAAVPLQELHGDAAARALTAAGVRVVTRARVERVDPSPGGATVRLSGRPDDDGDATEETVGADEVVLAVPPGAVERLLPPGLLGAPRGWARALGSSPIVNVHLVLDRTVLDEPFVAAVDSPLQWVFDRTSQAGIAPGDGRQYVAVSLSAADDLVGQRVEQLRDWVLPHIGRILPRMTSAEVLDFFVTREPHATFRPAPGSGRHRPTTTTGAPAVRLAGAWTATGWPATMEGAVRSGRAAAADVLGGAPSAAPRPADVTPGVLGSPPSGAGSGPRDQHPPRPRIGAR
jgi:squalene-associated FAD-dependent desaturase